MVNGSAKNLNPFFGQKISKDSSVKTNGRDYLSLKKDGQIQQQVSKEKTMENHFRYNKHGFNGPVLEKLLMRVVQLNPVIYNKSELNT